MCKDNVLYLLYASLIVLNFLILSCNNFLWVSFVSKAISYAMNNPLKQYSFRFQLQCCGLISGYDISDFITISSGYYPFTCCQKSLYDATNYHMDVEPQMDGRNCNLTQTVSKIFVIKQYISNIQ